VFPSKDWLNSANEASQFLNSGWGKEFRMNNLYFADLFIELDQIEVMDC